MRGLAMRENLDKLLGGCTESYLPGTAIAWEMISG